MSFATSVVLNPDHSQNTNGVLGPANLELAQPGTPGQPGTYQPILVTLNELGLLGWRIREVRMAEPWWPTPTDPPVWGYRIEKVTPVTETYETSVVISPDHSEDTVAVLGPAAMYLPSPGTPGDPSSYPPILDTINLLGATGWRVVDTHLDEGSPRTWRHRLERVTPIA